MAPLPATTKRIQREIADVRKEDLGSIVLAPTDNLFIWTGSLPGPENSVYEGGVFKFGIQLPNDYPFSAPKVTLQTKIYHMNISDAGNICLDILKHNWSPALSLFKVILSLSSLLTDPNPKDPLVPTIATLYQRNRKEHDATARKWTELYARPKPPPKAAPAKPTPLPAPKVSRSATGRRQTPVAGPSTSHSTPIVIDDSDDDTGETRDSVASKKRKREPGASAAVINLVDEDSPNGRSNKRRAGGSGSRRPAASAEIIDVD
ncbi:Ubiquitin-conjugating enzyme E2-16 kDa [Mycena kentingensis (nom. inval.)]|nr:Ubiquitin-conjugating enzyme E2-16 kDa [Mycena kentingensis (nom. inval.)]